MSKLDEFNQSVSALQQEVDNLQAIKQAYKQLGNAVNVKVIKKCAEQIIEGDKDDS